MNLLSKVVRIIRKEEVGKELFSLEFIDVTPQERQLLLRFSFDRQIAMKKKGLEINE
jgi:c-di-GMP-binding flagellar brake protein YcgR